MLCCSDTTIIDILNVNINTKPRLFNEIALIATLNITTSGVCRAGRINSDNRSHDQGNEKTSTHQPSGLYSISTKHNRREMEKINPLAPELHLHFALHKVLEPNLLG